MLVFRFISAFVLTCGLVLSSVVPNAQAAQVFFCEQNTILYTGCENVCEDPDSGPTGAVSGLGTGASNCGDQGYGSGAGPSQANKDQIWAYFKGKGLSDEAVAGMMGNMDKETGGTFLPDAVNWIGCSGIVQWCYGRNDAMRAKAAAEGKDWNCLSFQLDYIWYEMTETSESQVMEPLKNAKSAGEAANIFHDYYERSNTATGEHLGRDDRANTIFTDYTGKNPSPTPDSGSSGSSGSSACPEQSEEKGKPSGTIPDGNCEELIKRFWELESEGKIILTDRNRQETDFKNCTEGPITCAGGINPSILRLTIAVVENSSAPVTLWSHNTGHSCGGDHTRGKAVDIVCQSTDAHCKEMYMYLYENSAALNVNDIILDPPPNGQAMDNGIPVPYHPTFSNAGNHTDHIHVSVK